MNRKPKKVTAFLSAVMLLTAMAVAPAQTTGLYGINTVNAEETTITKDYIISTDIVKTGKFVSDAEVTEYEDYKLYTWYVMARDAQYINDNAIKVEVFDYGTKFKVKALVTHEFYLHYREAHPEDVVMDFLIPEKQKIRYNEVFLASGMDSITSIGNKWKASFVKKYDNEENFVDYTAENPECYVTYTADNQVFMQQNGADAYFEAEFSFVNVRRADGSYIDYKTADTSFEIFGQKFDRKFSNDIKEVLKDKSTPNLLYTKNFTSTSGGGYITIDENQGVTVVQNAEQSSLNAINSLGRGSNYENGNYYTYVAVGEEGDFKIGTGLQLYGTIEKIVNQPLKNGSEIYDNNNIKFVYDKNFTESSAKIFNFKDRVFKSGSISTTTLSLADLESVRSENVIYIAEGFYDADVSDVNENEEKQIPVASVDNKTIQKLFPEKVPEAIKGDINEDGTVNVADGILMQKYLLNMEISEDTVFNSKNADFDDDEVLNIFDFVMLKSAIVDRNTSNK